MLDSYYRTHRELGSKDRHQIADVVFGIMRWRRRLDGVLKLEGIARPTHAQRISAYVEGKHDLNSDPKRFPGGPAAYWSYPDFIYDRLVRYKGNEWAANVAVSLNREASVVIRVNSLKTSRDELKKILSSEGHETEATRSSPLGLILPGRININSLKSFKDGLFEVQDEASQLVGLLVDPKKDENVIDVCAGAGGKTLLMAMLMGGEGRIVASDTNIRKLKILKERAKQAGAKNINVVLPNKLKDYYRDSADALLIDAPCTGTGTLRRNPDLKWRLRESDIENCIKAQKDILTDCALLVKKGGRLIYATCSILPDENEEVANWFVKKTGWELIGENFRSDLSEISMDGFFAAQFKRP
jgi:16S rRNA (cytosine967-C5)-methyltransferase